MRGALLVDVRHRLIGLGILYEKNEILTAVVLDGRGRNQNLVLESSHQQAGVDELVGKQCAVAIVELGAQLYRTGLGVDGVIHRTELPLRQVVRVVAIVDIHVECLTAVKLLHHLGQAILGQYKDHRDRLDLGDGDQGGGGIGRNQISRVNQAKTYATIDGRSDMAITNLNLVVLNGALVVFDRALILEYQLLLIFQGLTGMAFFDQATW